ncbi:hypothetical protein B0T20DRAFT_390784 [Sordaria brevicollis]|uniref:Uncharacterized protein n=1 Tax=Sordaria brevicollis TaxID=83679 RepID=A0AAE0UE88_SORBR|nr:hypothetical protein B0T20DRAFT_390784 [Sordaria brevicollis]
MMFLEMANEYYKPASELGSTCAQLDSFSSNKEDPVRVPSEGLEVMLDASRGVLFPDFPDEKRAEDARVTPGRRPFCPGPAAGKQVQFKGGNPVQVGDIPVAVDGSGEGYICRKEEETSFCWAALDDGEMPGTKPNPGEAKQRKARASFLLSGGYGAKVGNGPRFSTASTMRRDMGFRKTFGRNDDNSDDNITLEVNPERGVVAATSDRTNEEGPYGYWPGGAGSDRGEDREVELWM